MKLIRPALLAAALAAAMAVHPATAEDNSARQFLNQEFKAQDAQAENAPANPQLANVQEPQQQPNANKKDENPWNGLVSTTNKKQRAALAPLAAPAPAANTDNAPILALIDKHAGALGIPVAFARAIVRIESNFDPRATGRQREVGLMQIKYETARGIGFTGTREELYEPDTNLKWGMKYLAMAWKLGGATPCGAVLRYQAGHAATQPTAASRAYCAKVNAHMAAN